MNLAQYLTATPFPVMNARKVSNGEMESPRATRHAYQNAKAEEYNQKVLAAMTEPDMRIVEIIKASKLGDSIIRRCLNRMADDGRLSVRIEGFATVWNKA